MSGTVGWIKHFWIKTGLHEKWRQMMMCRNRPVLPLMQTRDRLANILVQCWERSGSNVIVPSVSPFPLIFLTSSFFLLPSVHVHIIRLCDFASLSYRVKLESFLCNHSNILTIPFRLSSLRFVCPHSFSFFVVDEVPYPTESVKI